MSYWSCSKFADWCWKVAGAPAKPIAASSEGWSAWRKDREANYPRTYWFIEEGLDKIQNFVCGPTNALNHVRWYIKNRFSYGLHKVETGLEKGVWHETETRMLHANFMLLVEYVETQEALMMVMCNNDPALTFWEKVCYRTWLPFRSRRLGIRRLDWAIDLDAAEHEGINFGQSYSAMEIKDLYLWWTDERPARPDPWVVYKVPEPHDPEDFMGSQDPEDVKADRYNKYKLIDQMEYAYLREDEEMLIRLIKIRRSMWT
jgi:hypothetical protein